MHPRSLHVCILSPSMTWPSVCLSVEVEYVFMTEQFGIENESNRFIKKKVSD